MQGAIARTRVVGVATNLAVHAALLADSEFSRGGVDTGFLARFLDRGTGLSGEAHSG
jgi:acetyl/propionyl-CoA carboxylase alpha subunit